TVAEARDAFLAANGFSLADYDANWVKLKLGRVPLAIPNTPGRKRVVAMHDLTLDRTTDGSGEVSTKRLDEVRELNAAHWWVPGFVDHHSAEEHEYTLRERGRTDRELKVPLLTDALQEIPEGVHVSIEIKDRRSSEAVVNALRNRGLIDRAVVGSFSDGVVRDVRRRDPRVRTSPGRFGIAWYVLRFRFCRAREAATSPDGDGPAPKSTGRSSSKHVAIQVPSDYVLKFGPIEIPLFRLSSKFIACAHAQGLAVYVWTIDDEDEMRRLIDLGVDGIFTDFPSKLASFPETRPE
ncbi:MAG: glycerophosphodiester phosphodiesterase family protein, partial [Acidobacteriota bacterium]|nr:glycerophosphodiester phosphodiesterase family protein [Acidobacteriota bacterium]